MPHPIAQGVNTSVCRSAGSVGVSTQLRQSGGHSMPTILCCSLRRAVCVRTAITFALAFYAAFALLVWGVFVKCRQYADTGTPEDSNARTTRAGVVARMAREVFLFESLFKATKWTWLFGWIFHVSLALVAARHSLL